MNNSAKKEKNVIFSWLSLKIIAAISISVLIIQLAFLGYIEKRISASEHSKIVDQQEQFTVANAMYISELVSEGDEDNLYLILSSLVSNPHIVRAALIYPGEKEALYVGEELTDLEFGFDVKDFDANDNLITIATLSTYATTEYIDAARFARLKTLLGLIFLVFFVVLAISALAVQTFVGIPVKRITQAISDNIGMPEIIWNSRDEMGTVVRRLNFLHSELADKLTGLEEELSENERREAARITSLANATLEGILIFKDDKIVDMNEPMAQLVGKNREMLVNTPVSDLVGSDIYTFLEQPILEGLRPNIGATLKNNRKIDVPVEIYLTAMEDESSFCKVAVVRDISERVANEKVMWRLAHYDSLTNLPNRRHFSEKLQDAIAYAGLF